MAQPKKTASEFLPFYYKTCRPLSVSCHYPLGCRRQRIRDHFHLGIEYFRASFLLINSTVCRSESCLGRCGRIPHVRGCKPLIVIGSKLIKRESVCSRCWFRNSLAVAADKSSLVGYGHPLSRNTLVLVGYPQ